MQYPSHYSFISTKLSKMYKPICSDFGPVNLEIVTQFCEKIKGRLQTNTKKGHQVVCCGSDERERANAYFLLASYLVVDENWTVDQACVCFERSGVTMLPFRDASNLPADFFLSLRDCVSAVWKAKHLGWLSALAPKNCGMRASLAMADLSTICPKFFAFRGPVADSHRKKFSGGFGPEHYSELLSKLGASAVIQLSKEAYATEAFTQRGIQHHCLPLQDGKPPSIERVRRFLDMCETEEGSIGVHCSAGLGRTGTMIAAWLMRRHAFSAREAIAWLRIVRPGSVVGAQQHFLERHAQLLQALPLPKPPASAAQASLADTARTDDHCSRASSSGSSSAATAPSRPEPRSSPPRAGSPLSLIRGSSPHRTGSPLSVSLKGEDAASLSLTSTSSSSGSLLERLLVLQSAPHGTSPRCPSSSACA